MTHRQPTGVYRLSRAPRSDKKDWSTGLLQDASGFANALDAIDDDVPTHWSTGVEEQDPVAKTDVPDADGAYEMCSHDGATYGGAAANDHPHHKMH